MIISIQAQIEGISINGSITQRITLYEVLA